MAMVGMLGTISQVAGTLTGTISRLGDLLIASDVAVQDILPENVPLVTVEVVVVAVEIALEQIDSLIAMMGDAMEIETAWIEIVGMGVVIDTAMTGTHLVNVLRAIDIWTGSLKMVMGRAEDMIGRLVQEVEVTGMEAEGQRVMTGEAIGTGLLLMIVQEGEVVHLLMTGTEAWFYDFLYTSNITLATQFLRF